MKLLNLVPNWLYAALLALFVLLFGVQTMRVSSLQVDVAELKAATAEERRTLANAAKEAENRYRKTEGDWQTKFDRIEKEKSDEKKILAASMQRTIDELRKRPSRSTAGRMPENPVDTKTGTGSSLFAEDGEFLAREAARADEIRNGLSACYKQFDALQTK